MPGFLQQLRRPAFRSPPIGRNCVEISISDFVTVNDKGEDRNRFCSGERRLRIFLSIVISAVEPPVMLAPLPRSDDKLALVAESETREANSKCPYGGGVTNPGVEFSASCWRVSCLSKRG